MPRGPNPTKVKEWLARLGRFEQAGQTVTRFCENEGVSQTSFFQWRKKLKLQGRLAGNSFLPVQITPTLQQNAAIHLAGGIEIELGGDPRVAGAVAGAVVEALVKQVLDRREARPC